MNNQTIEDELREEYNLDYSKAKANRFASLAVSKTNGAVPTNDKLRRLRDAATKFASDREKAEARVPEINSVVEQLLKSRLLMPEEAIFGEVLYIATVPESAFVHYYLAGIHGIHGIGAYVYFIPDGKTPQDLSDYEFKSFKECPPNVQSLLAGQLDELLSRLMKQLKVTA